MTYTDAVNISNELRGRFDSPFNSADKRQITILYREVLRKELRKTNCQQCYHDALIEIILHLKKTKTMTPKTKYIMRAGFIIHSPLFHNGKVFTNQNITDEIAEEYMEMFPNKRNMFDVRKDVVNLPPTDEKPVEVVNDTKPKRKPRKTKKNAK